VGIIMICNIKKKSCSLINIYKLGSAVQGKYKIETNREAFKLFLLKIK